MTTGSATPSGEAFEVEFRWKEEVVYWEGDRGFIFDGAWGVDPMITIVPDEATWDEAVPAWLRGRRAEVLARLEAEPGHVVTSEDASHWSVATRETSRSAG